MKHVPPDNIAYRPVTSALQIGGSVNTLDTFWLDCSESEADAFLAIAHTNFPKCTRKIEQPIAHALALVCFMDQDSWTISHLTLA